MNLDYKDYFNHLFPGFFERDSIKNLPEENIAEEMIMDLHAFSADDHPLSCPGHITFGMYTGEIETLREAVREVDESWPQYFNEGDPIYCAFDGEKVVSFCQLSDFGVYGEWKVGGPGCVGTIPSYRRQGIGLKMIQNATAILKADGYDISHIHYTGVAPWYAHLGYQTVLKWNCNGFV